MTSSLLEPRVAQVRGATLTGLTATLIDITEAPGMTPASLAADFARFRSLLGATDGEGVFTPDEQ